MPWHLTWPCSVSFLCHFGGGGGDLQLISENTLIMQNSFTIYTKKHLLVGGFFRFAGVIISSVPFQNYIYTFCVTLFNACFCILYKFVWSNAFPHSYSNIGAILLGVSRWHWYTLSQFGKKSTWNLGNNAIRKIVSDPLTGERKGIVIILIFPLMLCISVQVFKKPHI